MAGTLGEPSVRQRELRTHGGLRQHDYRRGGGRLDDNDDTWRLDHFAGRYKYRLGNSHRFGWRHQPQRHGRLLMRAARPPRPSRAPRVHGPSSTPRRFRGHRTRDSATSVQFTPSSAGDWCFAGVYSGDDTYAGSSDSTTDECFEVSPANSSTTSAPESSTGALGGPNSDIATVTGSDGSVNPTGTVTFFECGPSVSPEPCTSSSWTQFDTQMLSGTSNPGTATSATLTPNGTGYWCFASVYSGDGNYTGSSDAGTDECFDVTQGTTSTASDPTNATIDLGQADTDLATVNGNAEGGSPTGSISFYECGPTATPEPCSSQANQIGTGVNLTSEGESLAYATSRSFTPNSTGYWCFAAYYSGDSRYLASSDTTVDECVDVVQPLTITTTSPLPGGTEHVHYIVKLQASGGTAPYTWVLVSGSLPSGVTLRSSGRVTGTPRQSGTFTFTVRVKDSASPRDKVTKKLKLIISH